MVRRAAGTPAPAPKEQGPVPRKVLAAWVVKPEGQKAGFRRIKGALTSLELDERVPPVVGAFLFDPQLYGIGSDSLSDADRLTFGLYDLLFQSKPLIGRTLDKAGFLDERDGYTWVQAVAIQTPVFAWIAEQFPGARWGGLPRWNLAFAVWKMKVVAIVGGMQPGLGLPALAGGAA